MPAPYEAVSARSPNPTGAGARRLTGVVAGGASILAAGCLLVIAFGFPGHATQLVDLWKISKGESSGAVVFLLCLVLMFAGWLAAVWFARDITLRSVWLPVAGITGVITAAFVLVYPATAIDVYIYAARSHLLTDYGLNPSTTTPERLWLIDPYVHYASREWSDNVSPYGPLWNLVAAPATAFDSENIVAAVAMYKVVMAAAAIGTGALVYSIARVIQPAMAVPAMLAWLWSPVVLWEGIANGHNDIVLMLLIVAALWCWAHRHEGGVVPLLGAAALLKIVAVLLIPAAMVAIAVRIGWTRRLFVVVLQAAVLSLVALWIAFAPFYDVSGTVDAIQAQRDVWVTSPAALVGSLVRDYNLDFDVARAFERFSDAVVATLAIGGAILAWKRPERLTRIAFEQVFWFLVLATSNLRPWYAIWLVALAVVLPLGWPFARAVAWSLGALGSYLYSAWIQNWTDPTWTEQTAINVAIMLTPPLVLTALEARRVFVTRSRRSLASRSPASYSPDEPART